MYNLLFAVLSFLCLLFIGRLYNGLTSKTQTRFTNPFRFYSVFYFLVKRHKHILHGSSRVVPGIHVHIRYFRK